MIDGSSPMPLYHQVAAVLRQRVFDGEYPPGERLAAEDDLAAEFLVSRATIRQAVGALVDEGLIVRRQGSGTYVKDRSGQVLRQRFRGSLSDLIRESHMAEPRGADVQHGETVPLSIATVLALDPPVATVVRRTRMIAGEPFAYTATYLPPDIGGDITAESLQGAALMELLIAGGVKLAHATQSIRAQLADSDLCARIDVDLGSPVLYVERVVTDADGRAVEFVRTWYRGDRYEYTVTLELAATSEDRYRNFA